MQATPKRPRYVTPFFLAALGLGLAGWYGLAWRELPEYSEADLQGSVEANLAVDLARMGPQLKPDDAGIQRLRGQIRSEVEAQIDLERKQARQGLAAGLICLVLAAGHLVFTRLLSGSQA